MRILHTMLRVGNLERSIQFYTEVLNMRVLRRKDYQSGRFTLAFLGYAEETEGSVLELTYNWDIDNYELGTAFGHIAIGVDDVYKVCEDIRRKGGKIIREPGPMKDSNTILAFITDPDGYKIELLNRT